MTKEKRNPRKEQIGTVISDKMDKTVKVLMKHHVAHPKYGKVCVRNSKFVAHDEKDTAKVGDVVRIQETRPLSKTKRWKVMEILRSSDFISAEALAELKEKNAQKRRAKEERVVS